MTISAIGINMIYGVEKNWLCRLFTNSIQTEKLKAVTRYNDKVGMLDTHLNQDEVDVMVKNNKTFFQNFLEPILIPS